MNSASSKTLERIVVSALTDYLEQNDLLTDNQFGFRRSRSTVEQLLLTYEEISKGMDNGYLVDMVFFDFQKAFDLVNHIILIEKLRSIGIEDPLLGWIADFLYQRKMTVSVHGNNSDSHDVTSGVAQGSVIGPLLFIIFINYVCSTIDCQFKMFADDLKLYICLFVKTPEEALDAIALYQANIQKFIDVAASWGLHLNKDKCFAIRFNVPISISVNTVLSHLIT